MKESTKLALLAGFMVFASWFSADIADTSANPGWWIAMSFVSAVAALGLFTAAFVFRQEGK